MTFQLNFENTNEKLLTVFVPFLFTEYNVVIYFCKFSSDDRAFNWQINSVFMYMFIGAPLQHNKPLMYNIHQLFSSSRLPNIILVRSQYLEIHHFETVWPLLAPTLIFLKNERITSSETVLPNQMEPHTWWTIEYFVISLYVHMYPWYNPTPYTGYTNSGTSDTNLYFILILKYTLFSVFRNTGVPKREIWNLEDDLATFYKHLRKSKRSFNKTTMRKCIWCSLNIIEPFNQGLVYL